METYQEAGGYTSILMLKKERFYKFLMCFNVNDWGSLQYIKLFMLDGLLCQALLKHQNKNLSAINF